MGDAHWRCYETEEPGHRELLSVYCLHYRQLSKTTWLQLRCFSQPCLRPGACSIGQLKADRSATGTDSTQTMHWLLWLFRRSPFSQSPARGNDIAGKRMRTIYQDRQCMRRLFWSWTQNAMRGGAPLLITGASDFDVCRCASVPASLSNPVWDAQVPRVSEVRSNVTMRLAAAELVRDRNLDQAP